MLVTVWESQVTNIFFPVLLHVVVYICEKASALMSSAKWITLKLSSLKQYKFTWRFLQVWNSGVGTCRWFCLCSWGCRQQVSQSRSYLKARLELGGPTFPVIQSRSLWAALPPHMGLSVIFDCPSPWWLASPTVSSSGAQTQATEPQMSHFVNRTVFCSFEMSQKSRVNNWAISCLFIFFFLAAPCGLWGS